jgi:hypothetical protein
LRATDPEAKAPKWVFPTGWDEASFKRMPGVLQWLKENSRALRPQKSGKVKWGPTASYRHLQDTWLAFAGFLTIVEPCLIHGFELKGLHEDTYKMLAGVDSMFRWTITSWVNQGQTWVTKRYSSIANWGQFYSTRSELDLPPLPKGTIGASRDGWLLFPWARGPLADKIYPTVGPYHRRGTQEREKEAFHLYTLYSLKGALPHPSEDVVRASLREHSETLRTPGVTPREILFAAETYGEIYASKFPPKITSAEITTSTSACLEKPVASGGRAKYLLEGTKKLSDLLDSHVKLRPRGLKLMLEMAKWQFPWGAPHGYPQGMAIALALIDAQSQGFISHLETKETSCLPGMGNSYAAPFLKKQECPSLIEPKIYETKGVAIKEQGGKARVVCVPPGSLGTLLHGVRTLMYSSLEKDHDIGTLSGDAGRLLSWINKVNKYLKDNLPRRNFVVKNFKVLSVDYRTATDTFHNDFIAALCRGYFKEIKDVPFFVTLMVPYITSPFSVKYMDPEIPPVESTLRGISMGNPASWAPLNLFNKFHWAAAEFLHRDVKVKVDSIESYGVHLSSPRFREYLVQRKRLDSRLKEQCGDDLIAFEGPRIFRIFEILAKSCGAIFSPGSHLQSRDSGIFTKQMAILHRSPSEGLQFKFVDILRVRSLSGPDSRFPGQKMVPTCWVIGEALLMETRWWPTEDPHYSSAVKFLFWRYHEFIKRCVNCGIEIYLPKLFGGLGYPEFRGKPRIFQGKTKRMISIILKNDKSLKHLLNLRSLGSLWVPDSHSPLGKTVKDLIFKSFEIISGGIASSDSHVSLNFSTLRGEFPRGLLRDASLLTIDRLALEIKYESKLEFDLKDRQVFRERLQAYIKENFEEKKESKEEKRSRASPPPPEWVPFEEAYDRISQQFYKELSFLLESSSVSKVPSIETIGRRFKKLRDEVIKGDTYRYKPIGALTRESLLKIERSFKAKQWSLWVNLHSLLETATEQVAVWVDSRSA